MIGYFILSCVLGFFVPFVCSVFLENPFAHSLTRSPLWDYDARFLSPAGYGAWCLSAFLLFAMFLLRHRHKGRSKTERAETWIDGRKFLMIQEGYVPSRSSKTGILRRPVWASMLKNFGCSCTVTATVEEARRIIPELSPDLILLNVKDHQGIGQSLAALNERELPVIVVSYRFDSDSRKAIEDYNAELVIKPLCIDDFLYRVYRLIKDLGSENVDALPVVS